MTSIDDIEGFYFSSQTPDIILQTDTENVLLTLTVNGRQVYSTRLYPDENGVAILTDTHSILETHLREGVTPFATIGVSIVDSDNFSAYSEFQAIYCEARINRAAEDYCRQRFLTTLTVKRVHKGSAPTISAFVREGQRISPRYLITLRLENGMVRTMTIPAEDVTAEADGVYNYDCSIEAVRGIIEYIEIEQLLPDVDCYWEKILACTVEVGDRSATLFYEDKEPDYRFTFLNIFGLPEQAEIFAEATIKSKMSKSLAACGTTISLYDFSYEKKYEITTAPMPEREAMWIEQLINSRQVSLEVEDELLPVIIDETEYEIRQGGHDLDRIKFCYRFTHTSPTEILKKSQRIFMPQFDTPYG